MKNGWVRLAAIAISIFPASLLCSQVLAQGFQCPAPSVAVYRGNAIMCQCPDGTYAGINGCPARTQAPANNDWQVCWNGTGAAGSLNGDQPVAGVAEGIAACTRAIATGLYSQRDLAFLFDNRGLHYKSMRQYTDAVSDFGQALELAFLSAGAKDPLSPIVPLYNRGRTYSEIGDFDNAVADIQHALNIGSPNTAWQNTLNVQLNLAMTGKQVRDERARQFTQDFNNCFSGSSSEQDIVVSMAACDAALGYQSMPSPVHRNRLLEQRGVLVARLGQLRDSKTAFQAQFAHCQEYDKNACDVAMGSSLATADERSALKSWRTIRQKFDEDTLLCKRGVVEACDGALASPVPSNFDRGQIQNWREAASPWIKVTALIERSAANVTSAVQSIPVSTAIVTGIALMLAGALAHNYFKQRKASLDLAKDVSPAQWELPVIPHAIKAMPPPRESVQSSIPEVSLSLGGRLYREDVGPLAQETQPASFSATQAGDNAEAIGRKEVNMLVSQAQTPSQSMIPSPLSKGFGIAALIFAILALFIPFGIFISAIAIVFAVASALAGDKIFSTATPLIAGVNTFVLSPSTWIFLKQSTGDVFQMVVWVFLAAPFAAMFIRYLLAPKYEHL